MGASRQRAIAISRGAALALAGASLAACASVGPRYPVSAHAPARTGAAPQAGQATPPSSRYSGYHVGKPYEVDGRWYTPMDQPDYDEVGLASWYGEQFHNRYTADGEVFDMNIPSAAHKTLPLPSLVEVTNLANGRKIVVRVNDRGPFVDGRIIDLSKEAAKELGFYVQGVTQVRVRYVGQAPDLPAGVRLYQASAPQTTPQPTPSAAPAPRPPRTQLATAPPVLGVDIEDHPLQASPSNVAWDDPRPPEAAPVARAPAPYPATVSPPILTAQTALPPSPAPSAASSDDIDSLIDQLAAGPPPPPVRPSTLARSPVQVGAFASRANAERAAARLSDAQIVPVEQSGRTLYKVMAADPALAAR